MEPSRFTVNLPVQRQAPAVVFGAFAGDIETEPPALGLLFQGKEGTEGFLTIFLRDSASVILVVERQRVFFQRDRDMRTESRFVLATEIEPIKGVRYQVLDDLNDHAFDGPNAHSVLMHRHFQFHVMTVELQLVAAQDVINQGAQIEGLLALTTRHTKRIENTKPFTYCCHLGTKRV